MSSKNYMHKCRIRSEQQCEIISQELDAMQKERRQSVGKLSQNITSKSLTWHRQQDKAEDDKEDPKHTGWRQRTAQSRDALESRGGWSVPLKM